MAVEIKEDDLFQYLMNSDFHEEYSPDEYKFLLNKWRYYYRLLHGQHSRLKDDLDVKLLDLEKDKKDCQKVVENSKQQVSEIKDKYNGLVLRDLTFRERIYGKIKKESVIE